MQEKQKSKKPKQLYHFTSVAVLCKLFNEIKGNNLTFHASSVNTMNDSAEYIASRNLCKDYSQEIITEYEMGLPFAFCLTESEYNIPMWSMYAKGGKGVCLSFNFSKLERYFNKLMNDNTRVMKFNRCNYLPVSYFEKRLKSIFSDLDYPNKVFLDKMKDSAFDKPDTFIHEKEWRLLVWNSWSQTGIFSILFKVIQDEIYPYIEIPIPVNILEAIILSPSASDQMIDTVRLLKEKYAPGENIDVRRSNITLKV